MRHEYSHHGLRRSDLAADPMDQFAAWMNQAVEAGLVEANAMVLSTVSSEGLPSSRTLLLKGLGERGFEFFTNYDSAKATDLAIKPVAAVTFQWLGLQRQVNVAGTVVRLDDGANDEYFALRPRESQLGAWASSQSQPLVGRADLEEAMEAASKRFVDEVPRPAHWGGYVLIPTSVEFWQGRPNRLHDRFRYELDPTLSGSDLGWTATRLNP